MNARRGRSGGRGGAAGVVALAGAALCIVALAVDSATYAAGTSGRLVIDGLFAPVGIAFGVLGHAIVRRLPGHAIGRIFCLDASLMGALLLAGAYAGGTGRALADRPGAIAAAWLINIAAGPLLVSVLAIVPLVFPDGKPLSSSFRTCLRLVVAHAVLMTIGLAFLPGGIQDYDAANPLGIDLPGNPFGVLTFACFVLLVPATALGALSLVLRFRRAAGVEREQVKWLLLGVLVAVASLVASFAPVAPAYDASAVVFPIALAAIPLGAGLAVLRYRLYDVDRLISRTIAYGGLTVVLGVAYLALVLVGQTAFASIAGGGGVAVAASTLVVAALFFPLRARVQTLVDRRFNRRRYDAQRTLQAFGVRVRDQLNSDALDGELRRVVAATMQPASISTWRRVPR